MRRLSFIMLLAAVLPLATSCESIFENSMDQETDVTISASAELGAASRSQVDNDGKFCWNKNDEIAAWNGSSFSSLALSTGDGTAKATFKGKASAISDVLVFPASVAKSFQSSELTVSLPQTYTFSSDGTYIATPMAATYSSGSSSVTFRHLCALVRFKITEVPYGTKRLKVETPCQMSGDMTAALSQSAYQIEAKKSQQSNCVYVDYDQLEFNEDMTFNIPFPVGDYSYVALSFLDASGNVIAEKRTDKARTLARADLLILTATASDELSATISMDKTELTLGPAMGDTVSISFECSNSWELANPSSDMLQLSQSKGKGGKNRVTVTAQDNNCTGKDCTYELRLSSGAAEQAISITQQCSFVVDKTEYNASSDGGEILIKYATTSTSFSVSSSSAFQQMCSNMTYYKDGSAEQRTDGRESYVLVLEIKAADSHVETTGSLRIADSNNQALTSPLIKVTREGTPVSMDDDGKTKTLQKHTEGLGIPLVLMGDAFSDTEISNGSYDEAMEKAYEYMFSIEPYTTLKPLFDVYIVYAVSEASSYDGGSTAFSVTFGSGTAISGDNMKARTYAGKAIGSASINDCLIIMTLNDTRYAGTTTMYSTGQKADIPSGPSIAYVPQTIASQHNGVGFEATLHHEAGGHGFGKLADEYFYASQGSLLDSQKALNQLNTWQGYGCYKNCSLESDVTKTFWADFASDEDYAYENLGAYEGAYTYYSGCYRPTDNSVMRGNLGIFNAPSRLMIYNRAMSIAYKSTWTYSVEKFKEWDKPIREKLKASSRAVITPSDLEPLAPPRLIVLDED